MNIPRTHLEKYLSDKISEKYAVDDAAAEFLAKTIYEKHNVKQSKTLDYCTGRISLDKASEFELYALLEAIDKSLISNHFTEREISEYSNYKFQDEPKITFPIHIKCVKVDEDQYIGRMSAKFLMELRSAQLIHYNKNAQRVMHQKIQNKKVSYVISLNESAVSKITQSFEQGIFIPNTITLNIPFDETSSYYYDEANCQLVINSIKAFDISDGYHRYIALSRIYDRDNSFDYPMEVRIINFEDSKTRTFIFQEDQKTKMKKIDSASMNMNDKANYIVDELNKDSSFVLKGYVLPVGGKINSSLLAGYIRALLLPDSKSQQQNMVFYGMLKIKIRDAFNSIINENGTTYYERAFTKEEIGLISYGIYKGKSTSDICAALADADIIKLNADPFTPSGKTIKKSDREQLEKIYSSLETEVK